MKNIIRVYVRDVKNIVSNWVALVIIIALMILPALYAWFNIKSAWDPYGNTKGIQVAVVNKDQGWELRGQKINIGNELIEKLKDNKNMGWRFVDEKQADTGVRYGKYYASITIPADFSRKILSITEDEPQKAELIYAVNEKKNPVAPKITQKGVSSIQQEIDKTFVQMVNGIIFDIFNRLGIELEKSKPMLKALSEMIIEIDNKMPEINRVVNDVYNGAITLEGFIKRVQSDMPLIEDTIKKASDVVKKSRNFLVEARDGLKRLSPFIKEELITARNTAQGAEAIASNISDINLQNKSILRETLIGMRDRYKGAADKIDNIIELLNSLSKSSNSSIIKGITGRLQSARDKMADQIGLIDSAVNAIDAGKQVSNDLIGSIKQGSAVTADILNKLVNDYDTKIAPGVDSIANNSIAAADNTLKVLEDAQRDMPIVSNLLKQSYADTERGIQQIKELKAKLPSIQRAIHTTAEKLRALNSNQQLNEIVRLLKNDARKESEFISDPVEVKVNRLYPMPNYGSAMSPFFTTLSLWVGGLIIVSLLSAKVHDINNGGRLRGYEKYVGRYLTFLTIAVFQALVVTSGDMLLLKVYVSNPAVFILFAVFTSTVFIMIIYTLVSVFGNVGKALSMILLVLQISASGGTFPIEVTPPFFQRINPFLPFTYAVSGMREAAGGILWDLLLWDMGMLSIYFGISILIGVFFKRKLSKFNEFLVEKFKTSGLVEE